MLVTGPTGSGKSTTLAAMVDHINKTRADHIITIEDPIEFVHQNQRCLVNQREVHRHTESFKRALRAALREDPDIVLVGEMRDLETVEIAIETAETGHLVFGTLHTTTAASTVDRIIDQFPADRQAQIRTMLADSLKGVIAQTLCKKKGGGRVAALEILLSNTAVASNIREGKTHQLTSMMQMGGKVGMRLLNDSLAEVVRDGRSTRARPTSSASTRATCCASSRSSACTSTRARSKIPRIRRPPTASAPRRARRCPCAMPRSPLPPRRPRVRRRPPRGPHRPRARRESRGPAARRAATRTPSTSSARGWASSLPGLARALSARATHSGQAMAASRTGSRPANQSADESAAGTSGSWLRRSSSGPPNSW